MLTDEEFVKAIRANPEDDAPWMMYADWLLDHGDPRADAYRRPRLTNSLGMRLALVPHGHFVMGSPSTEEGRDPDEGSRHAVILTRPFHLGVTPVTQRQYEAVMGANPSHFSATGIQRLRREASSDWAPRAREQHLAALLRGGNSFEGRDTGDHPVELVSWDDAVAFCRRLSELPDEQDAGRVYRLPTEAEWEYACRGGAKEDQPFHCGHALSSTQANFDGQHPYGGGLAGPFLGATCPVASYPPNAFGLFDLHGNVWEWCADWYDAKYYDDGPSEDPPGRSWGSVRVMRGGAWNFFGRGCRTASRYWNAPDSRRNFVGFRIALAADLR